MHCRENLVFQKNCKSQTILFIFIVPYSDLYIPNAEGISSSVPSLTTFYTPQNEELTYTELLHLCEDFEFDLTSDQLCDIAKATVGKNMNVMNGLLRELAELLHQK